MRERHSGGPQVGPKTLEVASRYVANEVYRLIVPAKFAKSEEFEISLETILWDSDTIICIDKCE
jgi:hypothetical protein